MNFYSTVKKINDTLLYKLISVDIVVINYYLVTGVGSIDPIEHISSITLLSKDSIRYSKLIRKLDKAFYPPIWNNKEELTKIKEFLKDTDSK